MKHVHMIYWSSVVSRRVDERLKSEGEVETGLGCWDLTDWDQGEEMFAPETYKFKDMD